MYKLNTVSLGNYCEINSGFAFKSAQFTHNNDDICLVKGSNLGHRTIDWENGPRWPVNEFKKLSRYELILGDIVLAMDRPIVGDNLKFAWIKKSDPKALLVQRVACLRSSNGLDQKYLRYVIADPAFKSYIDTITTGVNVPHISAPDIRQYKFPLPHLRIQKKIVYILSVYDDLIENNLKRIKLLEEKAQQTYEQWFVRMKFPEYEGTAINSETGLPEGWSNKPLNKVIDVNPTTKIRKGYKAPFIPMKSLATNSMVITNIEERIPSGGTKFINGDTLVARITPCLENGKTGYVNFLLGKQVATGSTEFIVLRKTTLANEFFIYCMSRSEHFRELSIRSMVGSDGRQRVNPKIYSKIILTIPPNTIMNKFRDKIHPIFKSIHLIVNQNQYLKEARDILLPRLMIGIIDINKIKLPDYLDNTKDQAETYNKEVNSHE